MHENGAAPQRGTPLRGHRHGHQALPHPGAGRRRRHVRLHHEARRRPQRRGGRGVGNRADIRSSKTCQSVGKCAH